MKKVGLWLAIAALLVNGPRFILIFLRVDNIDIPLQTEAIMLGATGLATGLVLTGGGAYIAHTLAESKARGMTQFIMVACWCLLLVFSVILLAPLMVASIRVSPLQSVFTSSISQWAWSITAVAAVEVIAAGAMAAHALEYKEPIEHDADTQTGTFSLLTGALARRIEHGTAAPNAAGNAALSTHDTANPDLPAAYVSHVDPARPLTKTERQADLLHRLAAIQSEDDIQVNELALHYRVARQTLYRDLTALKDKGLLQIENGRVEVLTTA